MPLQSIAAFFGQAGIQHPATLFRNLVAGIAGRRTGAFQFGDFALTPSASLMQLTIGRGYAQVFGSELSSQGGYFVYNNLPEVISWPAAPGSNSRVDSLILRIVDTDYGIDPGGSLVYWEVVSGAVAASPVPVPDSNFASAGANYKPGAWWRVANFQLGAGITNLAAAAVTMAMQDWARLGRHVLVRAAGGFPADAQIGDQLTQVDGVSAGIFQHHNGTRWERVRDVPVHHKLISTVDTGAFSTTETGIMTMASTVYNANRAYELELTCGYDMAAAANWPYFIVRKTNAAGQAVADFQRCPAPGASGLAFGFNQRRIFTVGGSSVTAVLVLTGMTNAGTATLRANTQAPRYIQIKDIGPASDYPTHPVLV